MNLVAGFQCFEHGQQIKCPIDVFYLPRSMKNCDCWQIILYTKWPTSNIVLSDVTALIIKSSNSSRKHLLPEATNSSEMHYPKGIDKQFDNQIKNWKALSSHSVQRWMVCTCWLARKWQLKHLLYQWCCMKSESVCGPEWTRKCSVEFQPLYISLSLYHSHQNTHFWLAGGCLWTTYVLHKCFTSTWLLVQQHQEVPTPKYT